MLEEAATLMILPSFLSTIATIVHLAGMYPNPYLQDAIVGIKKVLVKHGNMGETETV
jgi:hypothetical protein